MLLNSNIIEKKILSEAIQKQIRSQQLRYSNGAYAMLVKQKENLQQKISLLLDMNVANIQKQRRKQLNSHLFQKRYLVEINELESFKRSIDNDQVQKFQENSRLITKLTKCRNFMRSQEQKLKNIFQQQEKQIQFTEERSYLLEKTCIQLSLIEEKKKIAQQNHQILKHNKNQSQRTIYLLKSSIEQNLISELQIKNEIQDLKQCLNKTESQTLDHQIEWLQNKKILQQELMKNQNIVDDVDQKINFQKEQNYRLSQQLLSTNCNRMDIENHKIQQVKQRQRKVQLEIVDQMQLCQKIRNNIFEKKVQKTEVTNSNFKKEQRLRRVNELVRQLSMLIE